MPEPVYEGRAVAAWARDLRGDVTADLTAAIDRLGAGGVEAVPVLAALIRRSKEQDDRVLAQGVARAVGQLATEDVITSLREAPPDDADAALILDMIEKSLGQLERALIRSLADRDPGIRLRAVRGLERLGRSARGARAALEAAQQDTDPRVRDAAARALDAFRKRGE